MTENTLEFFWKRLKDSPEVLELGTRRWSEKPTHHREWFTRAGKTPSRYCMSDIQQGQDVNVIADAHYLLEVFRPQSFDAVFAASVWEHLHSPWIASARVLDVLRPGGVFFIQTHFAFVEHGYPNDYFRFTRGALEHLFRGAKEVCSNYEFPCSIVREGQSDPSYWNVCIAGVK